jgi:hypothetical protein
VVGAPEGPPLLGGRAPTDGWWLEPSERGRTGHEK